MQNPSLVYFSNNKDKHGAHALSRVVVGTFQQKTRVQLELDTVEQQHDVTTQGKSSHSVTGFDVCMLEWLYTYLAGKEWQLCDR